MKYTLDIKSNGVQVTADYGNGSTCTTFAPSFSVAIELIETWYGEDKNFSQWGQKETF